MKKSICIGTILAALLLACTSRGGAGKAGCSGPARPGVGAENRTARGHRFLSPAARRPAAEATGYPAPRQPRCAGGRRGDYYGRRQYPLPGRLGHYRRRQIRDTHPHPGYCRNVQSKRCRPRQEILRITRRSEMELAAPEKVEALFGFVLSSRSGLRQLPAPSAHRNPSRQHRISAQVLQAD